MVRSRWEWGAARLSRRTSPNFFREVRRRFFYDFTLPFQADISRTQPRQLHLLWSNRLCARTIEFASLRCLDPVTQRLLDQP